MTWTDAIEDADRLDDDALIEACLALDGNKPVSGGLKTLPDWPPRTDQGALIVIDSDIAAWFQARSSMWQRDIVRVLRAWMTANTDRPEVSAGPGRR